MINGVNDFAGTIFESWDNTTDYLSLGKTNKELSNENAGLRNRHKSSFLAVDKNIFTWQDTVYKTNFQYVSAKVVQSTVNRKRNIILINKGSTSGLQADMGVISPKGVVGIIVSVSNNYSLVLPAIHLDSHIAAKLKGNNQKGTVNWDGKSYMEAEMTGIPGHVLINEGDSIITSGNSSVFPEGLLIGQVLSTEINTVDNFYNIKLNLAEDFNSIEHVYVIRNLMKEEIDELLNPDDE